MDVSQGTRLFACIIFLAWLVWSQHRPQAVSNVQFVVATLFYRVIVVSEDMSHTISDQSLPHFTA